MRRWLAERCPPAQRRGCGFTRRAGMREWALGVVLGYACLGGASSDVLPKFRASDPAGQGTEVLFCDLDGDRLTDVALVDGTQLAVFYQGSQGDFNRAPHHRISLGNHATVVWPARCGKKSESLLLLTSAGVAELSLIDRTNPPAPRQIVHQPTVVPATPDEASAVQVQLSAATASDWPLLLVPVAEGIQVWRHGEGWQQVQMLEGAVQTRIWPSVQNPGYTKSTQLSLTVGDLNGDRREDLIVMNRSMTGAEDYTAYVQQDGGLFAAGSRLGHASKDARDGESWRCWVDLNRDGQVDLIQSTWLEEPWFLPGTRSGKVVVQVHIADAQGRIGSEPRQVFRKNDWTPALPVVDVDGDGFLDLALGYSLFDSREGLRKSITAKQLDFSLRFHFYEPGAVYAEKSSCQQDVIIHLDRHSFHLTWSRRHYYERFVNLTGDFDGDGAVDLLVRDQSDRVLVWRFISRQQGFRPEPGLRFSSAEPVESFQARDLNGDGVSDLIMKSQGQKTLRVFTSQRR